MNIEECIQKHGLNRWFASADSPMERKFKPQKVVANGPEFFIVVGERALPNGSGMICAMRMVRKNPSKKFCLYETEA